MPTARSDSSYKPIRVLPLAIAGLLVVALAITLRVVYTLFPPDIHVQVNGQEVTLAHDTTIGEVLDMGLVNPTAGDLVAINGDLLEEGAGVPYELTLNGEPCYNLERALNNKDDLVVSDGENTVEPCDATYTETAPSQAISGQGAVHIYDRGQIGITEHITGRVSGIQSETVLQTAGVTTFLSYNATANGNKVIALTFDDGPWAGTTAEVLDILAEHDVKATFFVVGNRVEGQADVVKRAYEEGHQICTHSFSHASGSGQGVNLEYMSPEEQVAEITQGYAAIAAAIGVEPSHVIRAPGGNYGDAEMIWRLEPYVNAEIGWNVDTQDWRKPGAEAIAERIKSAEAGEIVLMHDGGGDRSQTVEALRIAIPYLKEQGYTFVTIDELLAYGIPQ
ncbi:MAG: polysaccharide deacetylase family protein [Eggerthellaceae bacterium]|nr:polysaccharide deacetylase family protein [Eggerthellaceae bacterium]